MTEHPHPSLVIHFGPYLRKLNDRGFNLPNRATRSPDVAWIRNERWDALSEEEQDVFAPICPDFVVELRSRTDPLNYVRAKMVEYIENGALTFTDFSTAAALF